MKRRFPTSIIGLLLTLGAASAGPLEDGELAYRRGDHAAATRQLHEAAAQGSAIAQTNLGAMYYDGKGVTRDYPEAVRWFRLAAAGGLGYAQTNLGMLYYTGRGVPVDHVRAYMWFGLAAASGNADGAKNRDNLATRMTPAQIAEAREMARDCQQRSFKGCD